MKGSTIAPRIGGRSAVWFLAAIFGLLVATYAAALNGSLLWNDPDYVTKAALRSGHGLGRIWFDLGATEQYYPVLHSAFWLQYRLWGEAPLGYHLWSIFLHAIGSCLFALVLVRLAFPVRAAFLAALLFAVHPVCVESVAWISEEKNTLSLVFYLAAALAYLRFERDRLGGWYALATGLFVLALLSKSVTASLPASLLVVAWWRRGRIEGRRDVLPLVPWLVLGASVGLFTAWVERTYIGAQGAGFGLSGAERALLSGRIVLFYLWKAVCPYPLSFIYPHWVVSLGSPAQWVFPAAVVAVTVLLWRQPRRGLLAAWLLFVGSLFPVLGFFNVYAFVFSYVADHWVYLSLPPLVAAAAWEWESWAGRSRGPAFLAAGAILVAFIGLSFRQAGMYCNVETLYLRTLERNPRSWLAQSNLGVILAGEGRPGEAIAHYQAALREAPNYPEIHTNLGDAFLATGHPAEAMAEYLRAVAANPAYTPAEINLAQALVAQGHPAEAIPYFEKALSYQPLHPDWELNLGLALAEAGRPIEAMVHDRSALRLEPTFVEAHVNLANALVASGRWDAAVAEFQAALALRPGFVPAKDGLAQALYHQASVLANAGRLDEAMSEYRAAIAVSPQFLPARIDLALALATAGRPGEALAALDPVLAQDPSSASAHAYRGFALAQLRRFPEAVGEYETALRLKPNDPDILYQLTAARRAARR